MSAEVILRQHEAAVVERLINAVIHGEDYNKTATVRDLYVLMGVARSINNIISHG